MHFTLKKISLIILGITSIVCSRVMFSLFSDPDGPNLLVVIGMAAIIYFLSLIVFLLNPPVAVFKKFILAFLVQIIIALSLYFFLS